MLPLPPFSLMIPSNLEELKIYLAQAGATTKIIAGGTDLIPNLKHGLYNLEKLISVKNIRELNFINININSYALTIGSNTTLYELSMHESSRELFGALGVAARAIASPHLRNMGTVGGNLCLDTRCSYINQSEFWRKALNYCLKKDGDCCHVVKTGKRCVAASSNDLATILLAYDAKITILSPHTEREINLIDFYTANGEKNNILTNHEIISSVRISRVKNTKAGFAKLRHRQSIDFPLLSIGVCFVLDNQNRLESGRLVVNALVAKPRIFELDNFAGQIYSKNLVSAIACLAREKCHPQSNILEDIDWRKHMIENYTLRAFMQAHSWEP